ncbi:hypothetical protein HMPREF1584_00674 [Gardnerella vaginalis JCP8481A]|nr:hypothetical protein HMPREF1584_00674 [Gardnerella vaginalis JCP8481A]
MLLEKLLKNFYYWQFACSKQSTFKNISVLELFLNIGLLMELSWQFLLILRFLPR